MRILLKSDKFKKEKKRKKKFYEGSKVTKQCIANTLH